VTTVLGATSQISGKFSTHSDYLKRYKRVEGLNLEEINSITQKRSPCPMSFYNERVVSPYSEKPTQKNLDKLKPLAYKNVVLDTVYKI